MLEQSHRLTFYQCLNHVGKHGSNGVETLVCLTDVLQSEVVEEDLLDDENGNSFGKFRSRLHYSQAEGNDFGRKQEVDNIRVFVLLLSAANASEEMQNSP